jgi:hypothetical protein
MGAGGARGRTAWLPGAFAVALAACGGSGSTPATTQAPGDSFVDGTRLKARWVQSPGGPRQFAGWFDTQLGVGCQFEYANWLSTVEYPLDYPATCLPNFGSAGDGVFADAACTKPVAGVDCDDIHYVEASPPGTVDNPCTVPISLYELGEPVTGQLYTTIYGAGCQPLQAGDPAAPASPRLISAALPLTTFVTAQAQPGPGPSRVVPITLKGSDGSSYVDPYRAWDTVRSELVWAPDWSTGLLGNPGRWQSLWYSLFDPTSVSYFSDSTCSTPAASFGSCGDVPLKTIVQAGADTCSTTDGATFFDAGPELGVGTLFLNDGTGTGCRAAQAADISPPSQAFAIGSQIPATAFADVTVLESGQGQLHLRQAAADAGPITGWYYYDTTWQNPCYARTAADGKTRCLPNPLLNGGYSDPLCTVPMYIVEQPSPDPCAAPPPPTVVGDEEVVSTNACGTQMKWHEFPVTGTHMGPMYAKDSMTGVCFVFTAQPGETVVAYDLGAELPPGMFVELATSTDPPWAGP